MVSLKENNHELLTGIDLEEKMDNNVMEELPFFNYLCQSDVSIEQIEINFDIDANENSEEDENSDNDDEELLLQKIVASAEGYRPLESEYFDVDDELTCFICYGSSSHKTTLYCTYCELYCCFPCMESHISIKILEGIIRIHCPGNSCSRVLSDQLLSAFSPNSISILQKNIVEIENNPNKKTCPGCHKIEAVKAEEPVKKIVCSECKTVWCFSCHAPWHSNITCQKYQKDIVGPGEKALKYWAKAKMKDSNNARKCPSCHFYIERISGCDHMNCSRCGTNFCYKCGRPHRSFGWLGNHYSTYSFLGCKYNLHPKRPALRVAVRASTAAGIVIAAPIIASLCVAAGAVIIAASPVIIPIKIYKRCR